VTRPRVLRVAGAVPLLAIGLGTASAAARVGPAQPLCVQAASTNHAGIVVELGDDQVLRQCVGFDTSAIAALAVLQASGIEYATASYGGLGEAVCQIDDEPPSYTSCLPDSGSYWVFFISHQGGAWTNSAQGVSNATLGDGDDVGFRYDPLAGADPPPVSPAGTCTRSTPTPAPTAQPTSSATPKPTPVATPPPGRTASPTTSPGESFQPVATSTSTTGSAATPGASTPVAGGGEASSRPTAVPVADVAPAAAISSPFTPGLLVAACVVAALVSLLGAQGIRRRRR
jgi:hypothetical protein